MTAIVPFGFAQLKSSASHPPALIGLLGLDKLSSAGLLEIAAKAIQVTILSSPIDEAGLAWIYERITVDLIETPKLPGKWKERLVEP